jgi:hypothetical protein
MDRSLLRRTLIQVGKAEEPPPGEGAFSTEAAKSFNFIVMAPCAHHPIADLDRALCRSVVAICRPSPNLAGQFDVGAALRRHWRGGFAATGLYVARALGYGADIGA